MKKIKLKRKPTSPGIILSEEFLIPMKLTQKELSDHISVDIKVINRLINGRTKLSAEMAMKLAATFKNSPEFWLSLQYELDLFLAKDKLKTLPKPIVKSNQ